MFLNTNSWFFLIRWLVTTVNLGAVKSRDVCSCIFDLWLLTTVSSREQAGFGSQTFGVAGCRAGRQSPAHAQVIEEHSAAPGVSWSCPGSQTGSVLETLYWWAEHTDFLPAMVEFHLAE